MEATSPTALFQEARRHFGEFDDAARSQLRPLVELLDWIESHDLEQTLFVRAGLSGLWISDRPHDGPAGGRTIFADHVLNIYLSAPGSVTFVYHRTGGALDGMTKTVGADEALECFRQFLAYKFGIFREAERRKAEDGD